MAGILTPRYGDRDFVYLMEATVYDPVNRNLLAYSDDLSQATYWIDGGVSVAASAKIDPDGGTDAWSVEADGLATYEHLYQTIDVGSETPTSLVAVLTLQADSVTAQDTVLDFDLYDFFGAQHITPSFAKIVYGPGAWALDDTDKNIRLTGLSDSEWTQFEIVWVDTEGFVSNHRFRMYPGGTELNVGDIHIWRPHIEIGLHPDGRGFRSRGPRSTTTVVWPNLAAPGQSVSVRLGTEQYTTGVSDSYPVGGFKPSDISTCVVWLDPDTLSNPNRLVWTEDFSQANWTKSNVTLSAGESGVYSGSSTVTASTTGGAILQSASGYQPSETDSLSIWIKRPPGHNGTSQARLRHYDGSTYTNIWTDVPPENWTRVGGQATLGAGATLSRFLVYPDITTGTEAVLIWHPQLESGSVVTEYHKNTETAGGICSAWSNTANQANPASQGTTAQKPLVVAGAIDGKNAILFDGVDDSLSFTTEITDATDLEVWAVVHHVNNAASQTIVAGAASASDYLIFNSQNPATLSMSCADSSSTTLTGQQFSSGAWQLIRFHRDSADDMTVEKNGTDVTAGTPNNGGTFKVGIIGKRFGGSIPLNGHISALAIFSSSLNATDYENMISYFSEAFPSFSVVGVDNPANSLVFEEGLAIPAQIGVSAAGQQLILGVAETSIGNMEIANPDGTHDHLVAYDWENRIISLYRGEADQPFYNFTKIYTGTSAALTWDEDIITIPLRDPLHGMSKELAVPEFGGFGQCIRCDGTGDYVSVGENPDCWLLGDVTIQARVRAYAADGTNTCCIATYCGVTAATESHNRAWRLSYSWSGGNFTYGHMYSTGSVESASSTANGLPAATMANGDWVSVAVTRNATTKEVFFYINGDLDSPDADTYTNNATGGWNGNLYIGHDPYASSPDDEWKGDIDDVRIWNRVLTKEEVAQLSNHPIDANDYWDDGLVAYYKFDEGLEATTWNEVTNLPERRMHECYVSGDGVDDYITISHHADLNPTANDWTFEIRVATVAESNSEHALSKDQMYRAFYNTVTNKWTGSVYLTGTTNNWLNLQAGSSAYTPGQDGFVLYTWRWTQSTKELAAFVNGGDKTTTTGGASDVFNTNSNDLFLLAWGTTAGNGNLRGWLAEVRLWNEARSDANILANANVILTGQETNLKAWYTFDESRPNDSTGASFKTDDTGTNYGLTALYDRQSASGNLKNSSALSGATYYHANGTLQADARFVGTGEGYQDLMGAKKPYIAGLCHNVPLISTDPLNFVYYLGIPPLESVEALKEGGRPLLISELDTGTYDDVYDYDFSPAPTKMYNLTGTSTTAASYGSDLSTAAGNDTTDDLPFMHATEASNAVGYGWYIASSGKFSGFDVLMYQGIGTKAKVADGTAPVTISVQFWDGESWSDVRGLIDGTEGMNYQPNVELDDEGGIGSAPLVFTKTNTVSGATWDKVCRVRWAVDDRWIKDSIDNIQSISGGSLDATARWWIRVVATANPTNYSEPGSASRLWVSGSDAVVDLSTGLVKLNSPPFFPLTADVKGDNTGSSWHSTIGTISQNVVNRWLPDFTYTYASGFTTKGPDVIVGNYSGIQPLPMRDFLAPILSGCRSVLAGDRNGDLDIFTFGSPSAQTITSNLSYADGQFDSFSALDTPAPAAKTRYGYKPYFAKLNEGDVSLLLNYRERKDILAEFRWLERTYGAISNLTNYGGAETQDVYTLVSGPGATDTLDSEADKWSAMFGTRTRFFSATISTGIIEHALAYVLGTQIARGGVWKGWGDGPPLYIVGYVDNLSESTTELVLWGTVDADLV